jgi:superfamily II DNA or RNA helicase
MIDVPSVALRDYQTDVITRVWAAVAAGKRAPLIVAPTGAGKTVIAAQLISDTIKKLIAAVVERGECVLVLAHRRELIEQISAKLHAIGVDHGIIQAGFKPRPDQKVQVASIQTLYARAIRSARIEMQRFGLVIIDEAHHARANTYQQIIEACPGAIVMGLTATPCRGDGRGLGSDFDVLIECPQVPELIAAGFLVATKVYAPVEPDLTGVHTRAGDYVETELEERMNKPELVGDIPTHWLRLARRLPTIVFATSVAHSMSICDAFRRVGVLAEHLDGSTPSNQRDLILAKLKSRAIDVVVNVMVLTEGFDCPEVGCIVLARPTKSLLLYRQMIGRALRPAPGKAHALILDHAGATFQHGFVEEPIEWTLHPDRRAVNKTHFARSTMTMPGLTTCPECQAVRTQGQPCGGCGWQPRSKPMDVEVKEGDLGLVDRSKRVTPAYSTPEERDQFYQQLLGYGREKNYNPGWAKHKYREKFGAWPNSKFLPPVSPTPQVRSWIRSRNIAYAKAMEGQRNRSAAQ